MPDYKMTYLNGTSREVRAMNIAKAVSMVEVIGLTMVEIVRRGPKDFAEYFENVNCSKYPSLVLLRQARNLAYHVKDKVQWCMIVKMLAESFFPPEYNDRPEWSDELDVRIDEWWTEFHS